MKTIITLAIDKDSGIYTSTGEHRKEPPFLDYLLELSTPDNILCFTNLDYDVSNLLTMLELTHKDLEKLCDRERLVIPPYQLTYYKGKFFSIGKGYGPDHPWVNFCDLAQYDANLDTIEDRHDPEYWFARTQKAQQVGQQVYDILVSLGLNPKSLISPTNAYKEKLDTLEIPLLKDIPPGASEIAYECCSGNWVECYKRGHFPQVTDLDITSAYPYQASKLLNLRYGDWIHRPDYQPKATYGYARCEVMIDSPFSPVSYEPDSERQFTPTGIFERSLTKGMIDFINDNLGYATVLDGWWFQAKSNKHPLEKAVLELYAEKNKSSGFRREIVKRIMSGSFYGGFIQTKGGEPGKHFCSPWAAEIENNTRIEDARFVLDHNLIDRLISITVDGIVVKGDFQIPETSGLGSWRIGHKGEAVIVNSALQCIDQKLGEGDFSLSLQELKDMINADPDATQYSKSKLSVITLAMAVNSKCLDDLGKIKSHEKIVTLRETKRDWGNTIPETGKDLLTKHYNSKPWSIDWLKVLLPQPAPED